MREADDGIIAGSLYPTGGLAMDDEMSPIERAARALVDADAEAIEDEVEPTSRVWAGRLVRAVLQAIRVPSEGMVAAVVQQVGDPTPDQWEIGERANAILTETNMLGETACAEVVRDWQAMIDKALEEG
jgi:hypothetical protein